MHTSHTFSRSRASQCARSRGATCPQTVNAGRRFWMSNRRCNSAAAFFPWCRAQLMPFRAILVVLESVVKISYFRLAGNLGAFCAKPGQTKARLSKTTQYSRSDMAASRCRFTLGSLLRRWLRAPDVAPLGLAAANHVHDCVEAVAVCALPEHQSKHMACCGLFAVVEIVFIR